MVPPIAVYFQIFPQETFPLKSGVFKQPYAFEVFWNTGCLNTVQLKSIEDVGYYQL